MFPKHFLLVESKFRDAAEAKEIVASAIFFHGVSIIDPSKPAETEEEARAIVAMLEHQAGDSVFLVIPYEVKEDNIEYQEGKLITKPLSVFRVQKTNRGGVFGKFLLKYYYR